MTIHIQNKQHRDELATATKQLQLAVAAHCNALTITNSHLTDEQITKHADFVTDASVEVAANLAKCIGFGVVWQEELEAIAYTCQLNEHQKFMLACDTLQLVTDELDE